MSLAAHLLAARARKRAAGKQKEPLSLQPAAKRRRVAAALAGRHSVGEAARDLVAHQPGCNGASAANVGAAEDSGDEHDVEAEGGQASYEALLRSLQASRESDGPESGSGSGSSTDSEGEHAPGGATEGVRKGSKAKSTPVRERERQAACSTEPSRSRAARARAQLGGAATGSLGAKRWADQLHGARPVAAAAQARRRDGEADDAGAAWGQRMERHFGRCAAVLARAPCPGQHLRMEGRLQRGLLCQKLLWHGSAFLGGYFCGFESVVCALREILFYVNTLFRPLRTTTVYKLIERTLCCAAGR